jgi:hypothetical protein
VLTRRAAHAHAHAPLPRAVPQNTIAYYGAPINTLSATFLLANYSESTTIKWFVQPSAASPTVWYGPFPQVVNAYSTQARATAAGR